MKINLINKFIKQPLISLFKFPLLVLHTLFIRFPMFIHETYLEYYFIIIGRKIWRKFHQILINSDEDYAFAIDFRNYVGRHFAREIIKGYRGLFEFVYDMMIIPSYCPYSIINPMNEQISYMTKLIYILKKYIYEEDTDPQCDLWIWDTDFEEEDSFVEPTYSEMMEVSGAPAVEFFDVAWAEDNDIRDEGHIKNLKDISFGEFIQKYPSIGTYIALHAGHPIYARMKLFGGIEEKESKDWEEEELVELIKKDKELLLQLDKESIKDRKRIDRENIFKGKRPFVKYAFLFINYILFP